MDLREIVVEGTLKPDGTLELDTKPELAPGRVKVWMRPVPTTEGRPGERLVEIAARRREIDRQIAFALLQQKPLEPCGGAGIYFPFDRNPAIAAAAA